MRVSLQSLAAGAIALGALSFGASAAPIQFQTTVEANTALQAQAGGGAAYVLGTFDFTQQSAAPLIDPIPFPSPYAQLTTIDSITIDLQVNDGDSGVGDFADGQLELAFVEGLNTRLTGIKLNGFNNNAIGGPLSFSGAIANAAAILADLQADGLLNAVVVDTSAGGGVGDFISFIDVTTLQINGQTAAGPNPIPLPAAAFLAPIGAGLAGAYARRFRKQK